jgi:hypothetical protein
VTLWLADMIFTEVSHGSPGSDLRIVIEAIPLYQFYAGGKSQDNFALGRTSVLLRRLENIMASSAAL